MVKKPSFNTLCIKKQPYSKTPTADSSFYFEKKKIFCKAL